MNGNGCAGSIESGVNTGKIAWSNSFASQLRSCAERRSRTDDEDIFLGEILLQDGKRCLLLHLQIVDFRRMLSSVSAGVRPVGLRSESPERTWPQTGRREHEEFIGDWRRRSTRKRTRSRRGCAVFSVSSEDPGLN